MAKLSISFVCTYACVHIYTVNLEKDPWLA